MILGLIFKLSVKKPPLEEIKMAREYLVKAHRLKSETFACEPFRLGEIHYNMAMELWGIENEKFITYRKYDEVIIHATKSAEYSKKAIDKSILNQSEAIDNFERRVSAISDKLDRFDEYFGNYPLGEKEHRDLAQCQFLVSEGDRAWKQNDFLMAEKKLDSAEVLLNSLLSKYHAIAEEYFKNFPEWKRWFDHAVNQSSRKNTECIIIDKYFRKCMLYNDGVLKYSFEIELGKNWIGDKTQQGDYATPEGHYKVLNKKSGAATKYYKALLLDYPNENDRKRFNNNKRNGHIHNTASIGGMIEIHGKGGRGFDWTEGCIALKDNDMDILYDEAGMGTPVLIVGSLKSLEEIIK